MTLDDVPRELIVVVAAVALAWALLLTMRAWLRAARTRRRFERGRAGEQEGAAVLVAAGYEIEAAQVVARYSLAVDGRPVAFTVRADYVVRRGGQLLVAEVKTGAAAPRLEVSATRRQLLEYLHAFGVDGVVLVDADARTVQHVAFDVARIAG